MKRYTNNGVDFLAEGQKVTIDDRTYYCTNERWLNDHDYYEYVEQWGDGMDGVVNGKWIHYKGEKPAPHTPPTPPTPPEPTPEEKLAIAKEQKQREIDYYDSSESVNSFIYNGEKMWIDKATRVGLVNAIDSAIHLGRETITFGICGLLVTLPCAQAKAMMAELELYALACYDNTIRHKMAVMELTTIEEVEQYDITEGYPEKLNFNSLSV